MSVSTTGVIHGKRMTMSAALSLPLGFSTSHLSKIVKYKNITLSCDTLSTLISEVNVGRAMEVC